MERRPWLAWLQVVTPILTKTQRDHIENSSSEFSVERRYSNSSQHSIFHDLPVSYPIRSVVTGHAAGTAPASRTLLLPERRGESWPQIARSWHTSDTINEDRSFLLTATALPQAGFEPQQIAKLKNFGSKPVAPVLLVSKPPRRIQGTHLESLSPSSYSVSPMFVLETHYRIYRIMSLHDPIVDVINYINSPHNRIHKFTGFCLDNNAHKCHTFSKNG